MEWLINSLLEKKKWNIVFINKKLINNIKFIKHYYNMIYNFIKIMLLLYNYIFI